MNAQRVVSVVSVKKPGKLQLFLKKIVSGGYGSSVALIALFIVSSLVSPYFLTQINIFNLLRQICVYGFMSLGLTLVILSGNIDLSIGGVMTLCSLTAAVMSVKGYHPFLIILISLLVGGIFGLVNGLIVAKFRVESFVVTIGTQFIAFGLGYSLSGGKTILADLDPAIAYLSDGFIGPVPFPVILLGVTYAIFAFIISNTAFGHYIHALGGNEKAAQFCGVNTAGVKVIIYIICGALSGFAGVMLLARSTVGDPTAGNVIVLTIIASVIVGGNHFSGGIGNVGFTLIGLLILGMLGNLLNMLGVVFYVQQIIQGLIVVVAVVVSTRIE